MKLFNVTIFIALFCICSNTGYQLRKRFPDAFDKENYQIPSPRQTEKSKVNTFWNQVLSEMSAMYAFDGLFRQRRSPLYELPFPLWQRSVNYDSGPDMFWNL